MQHLDIPQKMQVMLYFVVVLKTIQNSQPKTNASEGQQVFVCQVFSICCETGFIVTLLVYDHI